MSKPGVNESSEQDFINVILTKDQERSNGNKKWMRSERVDTLSRIGLVAA